MELEGSEFLLAHAFQRKRYISIARTAWKFYHVYIIIFVYYIIIFLKSLYVTS